MTHAQQCFVYKEGNSLRNYINVMLKRSRSWVFTLNNPTEEPTLASTSASFLTFGREIGEQGTPHLQGFVQFSTVRSLSQVRNVLPRAHVEVRRGTIIQAIQYCQKDGDFLEAGQRPLDPVEKGNKEKERWALVWQQARSGK